MYMQSLIIRHSNMSLTLTLTGNTSDLIVEYFPPIDLSTDYICGLIDFHTYNSIPNIDQRNNLIHVGDLIVKIPDGSYEIDDIISILQNI